MTKSELEKTLLEMGLKDMTVRVEGEPRHWVAVVTSPEWADDTDGRRQERVWEQLLRVYGDFVGAEVEFVFTLTPDEERDEGKAAS